MSQPTLPASNLKLIRPASIELRFSNKKQYQRHVRIYRKALGITKPFKPPKEPAPYTRADSSYAFRVGMVPTHWKDQGLELRFVLVDKKKIGKNRTVVYWQVAKADFRATKDSLQALGYELVDPLHSTTIPPNPDSTRAILRLADSSANTSSMLEKAADGNSMGLVINPPYPRYTDSTPPGQSGPGFLPGTPLGLGLLGLALGLGLGLLVARLFRSRTAVR